jgi:hypothetical protein
MQLIELRVGEPLRDVLWRCRESGMSARAIGERLDVPPGTIQRWLVRFHLDDASLIRKALQGGSDAPGADGRASAT